MGSCIGRKAPGTRRKPHDSWLQYDFLSKPAQQAHLLIYSIDDEAPFFTAGHVFFTATGLRALDPSLAMKENPWSDIGRLSVGHRLLRLQPDSTKYEEVPIESISSAFLPDVKYVYGVHLREGRRSYHANRYLVAVNYPEASPC